MYGGVEAPSADAVAAGREIMGKDRKLRDGCRGSRPSVRQTMPIALAPLSAGQVRFVFYDDMCAGETTSGEKREVFCRVQPPSGRRSPLLRAALGWGRD